MNHRFTFALIKESLDMSMTFELAVLDSLIYDFSKDAPYLSLL